MISSKWSFCFSFEALVYFIYNFVFLSRRINFIKKMRSRNTTSEESSVVNHTICFYNKKNVEWTNKKFVKFN